MQALYAYEQAIRADYQLALDTIRAAFMPDLTAKEPPNRRLLEGNQQLGILLFEEHYLNRTTPPDQDAEADVRAAVENAITFYYDQLKKDAQHYFRLMVSEAEQVYDQYLRMLQLLVELADYVPREEDERQHKQIKPQPAAPRELKLAHNRLIEHLRNHEPLQKELIRRGINWQSAYDFVKRLYKEAVKPDETYGQYQQVAQTDSEADRNIVLHLIKQILFKHELPTAYFEETNLNWAENEDVIRSMLVKTIKSAEENNQMELSELSANWADDREFMEQLYRYTVDNDRQYEEMVSGKAQNWDVERVALVDKIMLKMAISEMLNFPSIPVKVTINEYIELAKQYSTPKSKQFINGLLDTIAEELREKELIKKSGRGLIDNN